jgi:peptidoglycan/LPS O-acetylase OafA/YrhL
MTPDKQHRHRHRRRTARLFLLLVFVALSLAEVLLWHFTNQRTNPWPFLRGHVIGSALATTALLAGIWRRQLWTRYVLIVFLWYLIGIFGIVVTVITSGEYMMDRRSVVAAVIGVALYLACNIVLIRSRRIQHLAQPAGSGG